MSETPDPTPRATRSDPPDEPISEAFRDGPNDDSESLSQQQRTDVSDWETYRRLLSYVKPYWFFFVIAVIGRFFMWSRMPIHVRWELYPVAHEAKKAHYGGSYMEETPLGRTEWIRFYGAFLDKDDEADRIFSEIEVEYNRLKKKTAGVSKRPKVLCNVAFKGDWTLPGGKSYMARFLEDAGASYPWADNADSGGFQVDMEEILAKAGDADIWLNPGLAKSLKEMKAIDSRYELFKPFKVGNVFNHTKRVNATGGHDFWERGAANPHLVLADYISIIHPDLLPNYQRTWYEKLPEVIDGKK